MDELERITGIAGFHFVEINTEDAEKSLNWDEELYGENLSRSASLELFMQLKNDYDNGLSFEQPIIYHNGFNNTYFVTTHVE